MLNEVGKTVFGTSWVVNPGKTDALTFTYRLPPSVADKIVTGTYRLDWPKQAGADRTRLTVDLRFGKNIRTADPPEPKQYWGDARYVHETDTERDRAFDIGL